VRLFSWVNFVIERAATPSWIPLKERHLHSSHGANGPEGACDGRDRVRRESLDTPPDGHEDEHEHPVVVMTTSVLEMIRNSSEVSVLVRPRGRARARAEPPPNLRMRRPPCAPPRRGAGVQRGGRAQVWTAMHTDEGDGSVSFLLHELIDGPNHEVHAAAPAVQLSPAPALSPRAPQSVFEPRMGEFCARSMQV
jgi:hypothetical protein